MLNYKANMALKNWKSRLRKNNYDEYETNEERKRKRPKGVKKEDWIEFVDRLSNPEEQAKCEKGKAARSKMHSPHITGRLVASGKKEILEKCRPKGSVKRSGIFLACHTKEDDTYPEEMKERMERMSRAIQKDPMLMDKDLDNDAVAVEYGADGNGHVRGYNGHLNKTNIRVLTPLRRVIEQERVKQVMFNDVRESLEVEANECRATSPKADNISTFSIVLSGFFSTIALAASNIFHARSRSRSESSSSASGRRCSPPPLESSSGNSYMLKDMFGANVAYGTVQLNTTAPEGFYSVIIDEVICEEAYLYVESRTLGDVST
ncbi:hypothetical protein GIB67_033975, partial [Kingdonia uniflora]